MAIIKKKQTTNVIKVVEKWEALDIAGKNKKMVQSLWKTGSFSKIKHTFTMT